ncbi:MAG: 2-C-methyl-D-erythritol 2,4-cyclodiphosphate synthase [Cellvibrionales bacterium]|nr:2-C-methyl-D-erythritol 2,4-cyclodiphosphate synthase [Cellvibrionales bacterium]
MQIRIGQGFDTHAFGPGDHLRLGGVRIPHSRGLVAHSDGDLLLHAICDALLGAVAAGDIGQHFPDTDPRWQQADSRLLLRQCAHLVHQHGYQIGNLDSCIIAQAPHMAAHIPTMRANIAADLGCDLEQISVKASTTEKLGFVGRKEGIAAQATVLVFAGGDQYNRDK